MEVIKEKVCCPVPDPNTFENGGPWGVNLGRGSCQPQPIATLDSAFNNKIAGHVMHAIAYVRMPQLTYVVFAYLESRDEIVVKSRTTRLV